MWSRTSRFSGAPEMQVNPIMEWIRSDELYQNPDIVRLPGFQEYVSALPLKELDDLLRRSEASLFYVRMVQGAASGNWKTKRTIIGLAERDLRHDFEINLVLLIEERAANEVDYLRNL